MSPITDMFVFTLNICGTLSVLLGGILSATATPKNQGLLGHHV
jgi:hypothetical protein